MKPVQKQVMPVVKSDAEKRADSVVEIVREVSKFLDADRRKILRAVLILYGIDEMRG